MSEQKVIDRRGFLKGSAIFAAVAGLATAVPASAQEQSKPEPEKKAEEPKTEAPADKKKLVDKDGREYRVCDMCGGNMYVQEKLWVCEQCGFSYEV